MSTAACSTPVRALIRLDLPELTWPTRATVTGCTGSRSQAAIRPAAELGFRRGQRERPAVRVGPAAEPAAVHFDQVEAHLPHEAEINDGQQLRLDFGRDRDRPSSREDQNRAMLTGFISIEATQRRVLKAAIPGRGRLQASAIAGSKAAGCPGPTSEATVPCRRRPVAGRPALPARSSEVNGIARARVIVGGPARRRALEPAPDRRRGSVSWAGVNWSTFCWNSRTISAAFWSRGVQWPGISTPCCSGVAWAAFQNLATPHASTQQRRSEPPDLAAEGPSPTANSRPGRRKRAPGTVIRVPQDEGPSGNHGWGSRWVSAPEFDAFLQLLAVDDAQLVGRGNVSLADLQEIPVPDPARRVHKGKGRRRVGGDADPGDEFQQFAQAHPQGDASADRHADLRDGGRVERLVVGLGQAMDQVRLNGRHHGQVDPRDGDGRCRRGQDAMCQNDRSRAAQVHLAQQFVQRLHLQQRLPIGGRQMIEDRLFEPLAAEIGRGKSVARRRQVDGNGLIEQAVEPGVMGLEAAAEVIGK